MQFQVSSFKGGVQDNLREGDRAEKPWDRGEQLLDIPDKEAYPKFRMTQPVSARVAPPVLQCITSSSSWSIDRLNKQSFSKISELLCNLLLYNSSDVLHNRVRNEQ